MWAYVFYPFGACFSSPPLRFPPPFCVSVEGHLKKVIPVLLLLPTPSFIRGAFFPNAGAPPLITESKAGQHKWREKNSLIYEIAAFYPLT